MRKLANEKGTTTVLQYIGTTILIIAFLLLLLVSIVEIKFNNTQLIGSQYDFSKVAATCFLFIMLAISLIFPSMLKDDNHGLSTMRVVVFMLVSVFITLVVKNGWNGSNLTTISREWMFIILTALGGKTLQSYAEAINAKRQGPDGDKPIGGRDSSSVPKLAQGQIPAFNTTGIVWSDTKVCLILWGSAWQTSSPLQPKSVIDSFNLMTSDNYINALNEYGIKSISLVSDAFIAPEVAEPRSGFNYGDVTTMIQKFLEINDTPQPSLQGQLLYLIVLPPNITFYDNSINGFHSSFQDGGRTIFYAWVTSNNDLNNLTAVLSHELVESVTNPGGGNAGIVGKGGLCEGVGGTCEICDVCQNTSYLLDDKIVVSKYWSVKNKACIPS